MGYFPDAYKKRILEHSEDIVEIARVLQARTAPDLTLDQCARIVESAHMDATIGLFYTSLHFTVGESVRKIK